MKVREILYALLVTFLWSTSFVLIKLGLKSSIPPLTFAGLRYALAFVCLIPFVVVSLERRERLKTLSGASWRHLALLGLVYFTLAQGLQFIGLKYLPAATVSLVLNFTPLLVAVGGGLLLGEKTSSVQWLGVALTIAGALVYFLPLSLPAQTGLGLLAVVFSMLANAGGSLLGRHINRSSRLDSVSVTAVSMGLGSLPLLCGGLALQGLGSLTWGDWAIVGWLAVVNTALAFTLWNRTLRTLSAVESSVLNCTMLPQIAILAWVFLGESLDTRRVLGLCIAVLGVVVVQRRK